MESEVRTCLNCPGTNLCPCTLQRLGDKLSADNIMFLDKWGRDTYRPIGAQNDARHQKWRADRKPLGMRVIKGGFTGISGQAPGTRPEPSDFPEPPCAV